MKTPLLFLLCAGTAFLAAPVAAESAAEEAIQTMNGAAHQFLASLTEEQRALAQYPFESDQRFELRLAPMPSWGGLPAGDMSLQQQVLANILLSSSLSVRGLQKATGVMALEGYLVEVEAARGRVPAVHGMENYSVAIFGEPKEGSTWGWRIQGHHLSLNFLVADGKVSSHSPAYYGAEPHYVSEGPRKGWHVLGAEEKLGRALMAALDDDERRQATISDEMPRDLFVGNRRTYDLETPAGVAYAELAAAKQEALRNLVEETLGNARFDVEERRRAAVEKGGWENVRFAWIGSMEPGERMYYRVQGPEFIIEYCAVALSQNHVHTIWREKNGDFGRDLLAEHMREGH